MNLATMKYNSCVDLSPSSSSHCTPRSYDHWLEWATQNGPGTGPGRRRSSADLLSEYVDPKVAHHMELPTTLPPLKKRKAASSSKHQWTLRDDSYYFHEESTYSGDGSSVSRKRSLQDLELYQYDGVSSLGEDCKVSYDEEQEFAERAATSGSWQDVDDLFVRDAHSRGGNRPTKSHGDASLDPIPGLFVSSTMVERQEEIWKQIQKRNRKKKKKKTRSRQDQRKPPPLPIATPDDTPNMLVEKTAALSLENVPSKSAAAEESAESFHLEGRRVKLLPQSRTERASRHGSAVHVKCIGCEKDLVAVEFMTMIYCPECGTLASADLLGKEPNEKW